MKSFIHYLPKSLYILKNSGTWLFFIALLAAAPYIFDSRLGVSVLNEMGITIIFALSYNMLLGQGGMLSFGHAVYFGIGGFMSVHMLNYVEEDIFTVYTPLIPFFGGLCGLLFAIVIGSFSTRRSGTVFAMISLGLGEMVAACSLIFVAFFGGEGGISGDRTYGPPIFGHDFGQDIDVYVVIALWVFVAALLMYLYSQTPVGRMANAVRNNPERAEFVGYSQRMVRFVSFCMAGFFAGVAGGLSAINYELVTAESISLAESTQPLLIAYIGGTGFFVGPMIGAVLLTLLQSVASAYTELWQLYLGILFLVTVMFMPSGISGVIMKHRTAFQLGKAKDLVVPYALAVVPVALLLLSLISLIEMIGHRGDVVAGEYEMQLFFFTVDTQAWLPWIIVVLVVAVSIFLVRLTSLRIHQLWEHINTLAANKGSE